jgi:hypothetical protein
MTTQRRTSVNPTREHTSAVLGSDYLEIERVAARANHAVDDADGVAFAACFTPDAVYGVDPGGPITQGYGVKSVSIQGREALEQMVSDGPTATYRHWNTNRCVSRTEDGVHSVSYMHIHFHSGSLAGQMLTGIQSEQFVHTDDGWRICARHLQFDQ